MNTIVVGSDHAGFLLKEKIATYLKNHNYKVVDIGCENNTTKYNFPIYANKLCHQVIDKNCKGILICGSGIGMSMAANRFTEIRCALCYNIYAAKMAHNHTNANVLALGERVIDTDLALNIVKTFLTEQFLEGHYTIRVNQLSQKN